MKNDVIEIIVSCLGNENAKHSSKPWQKLSQCDRSLPRTALLGEGCLGRKKRSDSEFDAFTQPESWEAQTQ